MKKISFFIMFLFFSFTAATQNDSITKKGIISVEKLNIVYRGIVNPLTIAIPNSKSFTAEGLGLKKLSEGKYILSPGQGLEAKITLNIILNDDSTITEEHFFRIKNLPKPLGLINGQNCLKCIVELSRKELKDALISVETKDFLFPYNLKVKSFNVVFSDEKGFIVSGNQIDENTLEKINKLKKGSIFKIGGIQINTDIDVYISVVPVKIMIID